MSYIQFPLPRFTFQQKAAAPCDTRVYLANVIWVCDRVICGGRDVLTGPKLLSNTPDVNRFLWGWKRDWGFQKVYLSFSEAFQFLGCSWMCSQVRGDTLGKNKEGRPSWGQWEQGPAWLPALGQLMGCRSSALDGGGILPSGRIEQQKDLPVPVYFISPASILSLVVIIDRPCGSHQVTQDTQEPFALFPWNSFSRQNMFIYSRVALLCTWNYHSIVNRLYSNVK